MWSAPARDETTGTQPETSAALSDVTVVQERSRADRFYNETV